ncbi:MAG: hypothetical protein JRE43_06610, partial [Deltaproteobacteria bacterium]|jgi:hypothetical protein|nr:hypothetical protein [Deltaproteobacteria bacterium]
MANLPDSNLPGADLRKAISGEWEPHRIIYAQQFRSRSLVPRGWGRHHSLETIEHLQSRKAAAISGTLKRIVMEDGIDVSFDLLSDPDEVRPLRDPGWTLPVDLPRPDRQHSGRNPTDPGTEAALRALGYIR